LRTEKYISRWVYIYKYINYLYTYICKFGKDQLCTEKDRKIYVSRWVYTCAYIYTCINYVYIYICKFGKHSTVYRKRAGAPPQTAPCRLHNVRAARRRVKWREFRLECRATTIYTVMQCESVVYTMNTYILYTFTRAQRTDYVL